MKSIFSSGISRRNFLALSSSLSVGALLAACAPANGQTDVTSGAEETTEGATAANTEILVWAYPDTENDQELVYGPLNENFNEAYPAIEVNVDVQPWASRREKLYAAAAAGAPPDLWYATSDTILAYKEKNVAQPLDDIVDADLLAQFTTGEIDVCTLGGNLLLAPVKKEIMGFQHNRELMEACGFDPVEGISTWDELLALAKVAKENDWYVDFISTIDWLHWLHWIRMAGGSVYTEDGSGTNMREEPAVAALSMWVMLFQDGYVPQQGAVGSSEEASGMPNYFLEGRQLTSNRINCLSVERQLSDFPLEQSRPRRRDESYELVSGSDELRAWCITTGSTQKEAAGNWLNHMIRPEMIGLRNTVTGGVPTGTEATEFWDADPCVLEWAEKQAPNQWFNQDNYVFWQESKVICAPYFQAAVLGVMTVEEALETISTELEVLIAEKLDTIQT